MKNNAVACQASYRNELCSYSEHMKINKHVASYTGMGGARSYLGSYAQKRLVTDRKCCLAVCATKPEPRVLHKASISLEAPRGVATLS